jgi:MSHA biogenesis protein MshO
MNKHQRGFTLIELIIVMIVTSIVVVMISAIISRPLTGYFDTQRRADLADRGQAAINRMAFELENSVPNSVRISGTTIEFMPVLSAGRYRSGGAQKVHVLTKTKIKNNPPASPLTFNSLGGVTIGSNNRIVINNTTASILYADATDASPYTGVITAPAPANGITTSDCWVDSNSDVYADATDASPYTGVITAPAPANGITTSDCWVDSNSDVDCADGLTGKPKETRITIARGHEFNASGNGSPSKRFYLAKDAVTYNCDTGATTLKRYTGYPLVATQVAIPTATSISTLATGVTACTFSLKAPSAAANLPIVIISLEMTADGEKMTLFKEVQLWNAP